MKPRVKIVLSKKEHNHVVTNMYLDTILEVTRKIGFIYEKDFDIKEINKFKDFIIVDTCKTAFEYWLKGYRNIILWVQGVVPEEAIMLGYHKYRYYAHSYIERVMLKRVRFIFMVSQCMLKHYENKYNLSLRQKTFVMPCFNENRLDELSFKDPEKYLNNTFLYAGSLQKWQCFTKTIEIYKKIEEKINNSKLFIYTNDKDKAEKIIKQFDIKNYYLSYVSSDELGQKIRKIKFGFVLRENNVVNNVATPTKLSNYISHGIIPIYSPCLRSFNEYNNHGGLAIPFDLGNINLSLSRLIRKINSPILASKVKEWCESTFRSYYDQEKYIDQAAMKLKKVLCNE